MDIVRLHERALDETARLVGGVRPDQMDLPTPCSDWDVRALLAHLIGGNVRWAALARGEPMWRGPARGGEPGADLLGDDPAGAYRRSAEALKAAWQDPALLDRPFELPIGVLPGRAAVNLRLVETVAHAWDLAKATGQKPAFDPDVVQAAAQFAYSALPEDRPPGTPFAAPVPVADDLSALDRLAAFLGRTP
jgi:uncharacterized protein (TIGR03086 family)